MSVIVILMYKLILISIHGSVTTLVLQLLLLIY